MVEPYETDDYNRRRDDNEETNDDYQAADNKKENQNKIRLYRIAKQIHEKEDIFVDQYHTPYAFVKINDHMEVLDVYSLRFQHWVYRKLIWYDNNGRAILPESVDVARILDYLKAHAEFDAVQKVLHLRVAAGDDANNIYYDLTSPLWEAIKITPQGWLIEKTPTMMFRRYKNQTAQVYPSGEYPSLMFLYLGPKNYQICPIGVKRLGWIAITVVQNNEVRTLHIFYKYDDPLSTFTM